MKMLEKTRGQTTNPFDHPTRLRLGQKSTKPSGTAVKPYKPHPQGVDMKIILMAILFSGVFGIAYAEEAPLQKPEVLGNEEIFTSVKLSAYTSVVVNDFTTADTEYVNLDKDEKKVVEEIKTEIVKNLTGSLVERVKDEGIFKTVVSNSLAMGSAIIVKGKFTQFNGGNGAAKFFLGFMTPEGARTNVSISGQLVDAETGKVLASFSDTRSGARGYGYNIRDTMPIQAKDQGENIADFIIKLAQ
jgi:hypothetical protein